MASAALHALAATSPKDLTQHSELGQRRLHDLVIHCQAAGLTAPVDNSNDVALLHTLFDVALQNGLGAVVYDYVVEVAADKYCTSRWIHVTALTLHSWCTVLHCHIMSIHFSGARCHNAPKALPLQTAKRAHASHMLKPVDISFFHCAVIL